MRHSKRIQGRRALVEEILSSAISISEAWLALCCWIAVEQWFSCILKSYFRLWNSHHDILSFRYSVWKAKSLTTQQWPVTSSPIPLHTEEKFKDTHLGTLEPLSELSGLPLLLQVSAHHVKIQATVLPSSETFCLDQKPFGDRGFYIYCTKPRKSWTPHQFSYTNSDSRILRMLTPNKLSFPILWKQALT